jgi:excisionase family DNA binding protein
MPREEAEFGAEFVKHAFRRLDDESFDIYPDPFGSVFLFETPAATSQFDRRWISEGKLKALRVGARVRVRRGDLNSFIRVY